MCIENLPPWEVLMKKMAWRQLGEISGKRILDFGSGMGITANYLAEQNEVTAIEPSAENVKHRWRKHDYRQLCGSTEHLKSMEHSSFDIILCHNVLEYAADREKIVREFSRILKPDGFLSLIKHHRPGRVMQMVVLLNQFDHANALLDGADGQSAEFGAIHYYEDKKIEQWCPELEIVKTMGMRTFWDLQQNQEIQQEKEWQEKMLQIEMKVSEKREYQEIAFFHHLIVKKALYKPEKETNQTRNF